MIGPFNWIDLAFLVTIALLVFNGLRNGALFSLVHLLGIPIALGVTLFFGKPFTMFLNSNGLSVSPLIAYIVLFFVTILVIHIIGTMIRGVVRAVPFLGLGDVLLGGLIGFIEAWLLWVIVLLVIGNFLGGIQNTIHAGSQVVPGLNITVTQYQDWLNAYNQALNNSLFAHVNGFIIKTLPVHISSLLPHK
ncbi:MAG TPA: CvpA family protein [Ktedonobacteraceae bacterium]|jgi:uncharacterized membrane protein required for colicin V production|nr:CvpA family protein [Ktedonobacteraceae bacterium]